MKIQSTKLIFVFLCLVIVIYFLVPSNAFAFSISNNVNSFGSKIYGGTPQAPQQIAALLIKSALALLGIVFVALILYGGFIIMTAAGNPEHTKKGKNIILYASIGLIIIIAAYAIATFILTAITNSVGGGASGPSSTPQGQSSGSP